jgi:hypothetical protein
VNGDPNALPRFVAEHLRLEAVSLTPVAAHHIHDPHPRIVSSGPSDKTKAVRADTETEPVGFRVEIAGRDR